MNDEIFNRIQAAIQETTGIAFAYLYGSFLERDSNRDIDVGIWLGESSCKDCGDLLNHLHSRLDDLNVPVDLRILNDAPVTFLFHVLKGRLIEVRDEEVHDRVFEETLRTYLDVEPLLRRATVEAFGE